MTKEALMRGSLCLVIAVLFQGIRLVIPLPPFFGMFLIGSLVNMALVLAVLFCGKRIAVMIGCLLPLIAFFQGQLFVFLLIPVVAIANIIWVLLIAGLWDKGKTIWFIPLIKALFLYGATAAMLQLLQMTGAPARAVAMMMSWPQVVTGVGGLALAAYIVKKIPCKRY